MKKAVGILRTVGVFAASLGLALVFEHCSPIAPSSNKTLLHGSFSFPTSSNAGTAVTTQETESPLQGKAAKATIVMGKIVDKESLAELFGQTLDESKPNRPLPHTTTLERTQIKELRDHRHTLVQLNSAPSAELAVYLEVFATPVNSADSVEKDGATPIEIRFVPMGPNTWMLYLGTPADAKVQELDSSESKLSWLTANLRQVILLEPTLIAPAADSSKTETKIPLRP